MKSLNEKIKEAKERKIKEENDEFERKFLMTGQELLDMFKEEDEYIAKLNYNIKKDYTKFKKERRDKTLQELFEYGTDVIRARIIVLGGGNSCDFGYQELHYSEIPTVYGYDSMETRYLFGNFSTIIDVAKWDDEPIILLEKIIPFSVWDELDYYCEKKETNND